MTSGNYCAEIDSSIPTQDVLVTLTTYEQTMQSRLHYHVNAHISLVLNGIMEVRRKGLFGNAMAIEHLSYMHAGEPHQNRVLSKECKNINIEIEEHFFRKYDLATEDAAMLIHENSPDATILALRVYHEILAQDDCFADSIKMLLLDFLSKRKTGSGAIPGWLKDVRDMLNDRWDETINLQDLSAAVNVHPVNISKYFMRISGMTLGKYRRCVKVKKAAEMMATNQYSLTEISYICGFSDQSHFIRSFKEFTGMKPSDLLS